MRPVTIYGLKVPGSREFRYVGATVDPRRKVERLLNDFHKYRGEKRAWVVSLNGQDPVLEPLAIVDESVRDEMEAWFIVGLRNAGHRLVNRGLGGFLNANWKRTTEEARANGERLQEWHRTHPDAHSNFAKKLAASRTKKEMATVIEKMSKASVAEMRRRMQRDGFFHTEETKKKIGNLKRGQRWKLSPETRARQSAAQKLRWSNQKKRNQ